MNIHGLDGWRAKERNVIQLVLVAETLPLASPFYLDSLGKGEKQAERALFYRTFPKKLMRLLSRGEVAGAMAAFANLLIMLVSITLVKSAIEYLHGNL